MRKISKILYFLPLFYIVFISCEDSKLTEPVQTFQEGMIPLKVGFKWNYKVSLFNDKGVLVNTYFFSSEVVKDTLLENEKWFFVSIFDSTIGNLYTNRNKVTYFYNNGNPLISFNTIIEDTTKAAQSSNSSYLISKDIFIQVPYGNFMCNQYAVYNYFNGKKSVLIYYYVALNKGQIKTEYYSLNDNGESYIASVIELVSTNVF